jgi:D-alanine-D-alanine ligase
VKPNAEGSSVGVFMVFDGANQPPQELVAPSWTYGEEVMIEPYIRGKELACGVMDGKAMTVTEIVPRTGFYDYEAKYVEGGSTHVVPAEIAPRVIDEAKRLSELAHAALGCRGVTRSDLRYDDINDILVLLEVNTQPGMTPTSLVPEQAATQGVDFDRLVLWITEDAYARGGAGGIAGSRETSGQGAP